MSKIRLIIILNCNMLGKKQGPGDIFQKGKLNYNLF